MTAIRSLKRKDLPTHVIPGNSLPMRHAVRPVTNSKGGRPSYLFDDRDRVWVLAMCACGWTHSQISKVMGINRKTLSKHFSTECKLGVQMMVVEVAASLYRKAMCDGPGSVAAAIFILKARGGWRTAPEEVYDKSEVEVSDFEDPLITPSTDLTKLTDEEFREIWQRAKRGK